MGSVLIKAGDSKLKRASEFSTICAYAGSRMDVIDKFGIEPLMGKFQNVAIIIIIQHNAAKCYYCTATMHCTVK